MKLQPTRATLVFALAAAGLLAGCASSKAPVAESKPVAPIAAAPRVESTGKVPVPSPTKPGSKTASEVRTRNAMFKVAAYDELPGWQQDDMRASWSAFRNSCDVLQKREDWRDICNAAKTVPPNTPAMRRFFES